MFSHLKTFLSGRSGLTRPDKRRAARTRSQLGVEQLEERCTPSVSNVSNLSIVSLTDVTHSATGTTQVSAQAGDQIQALLSYTTSGNGSVVADYVLAPHTANPSFTDPHTYTSLSYPTFTSGILTLDTTGLAAGQYDLAIFAKQQSSTTDEVEASSAVEILSITITPTVTATAADSTYNGAAYATSNITTTVTPTTASGTLSYTYYDATDPNNPTELSNNGAAPTNAGSYAVVVHFASSDSTQWTNADSGFVYFEITPKTITGSFTAQSRQYDGTTSATITGTSLSGVIPGDDVSLDASNASASFASADVGTWTVTGTGFSLSGAAAGNYVLDSVAPTTAQITPHALTVDSATTQGTINIAKAGTISFALDVTGFIGTDTAALFNGAHFTIAVDGVNYNLSAAATVSSDGTINVSMQMSQDLQNALLDALANNKQVDFTLSAVSTGAGDYSLLADAFSNLISQGKLKYAVV